MDNYLDRRRADHLVETQWLAEHLGDPDLRIVDMRGSVQPHTDSDGVQSADYLGGREEYLAEHIPGAVYLDWTKDIVDTGEPIPAQVAGAAKIASVFGAAGIGRGSHVIAYDAHPASQFATRLWWVLKLYGHERVSVLNGGWPKWKSEGQPTSSELPVYPAAVFEPRLRTELRADADSVRAALRRPDTVIVDARDAPQYSGAIRRGPRGGHIPGAVHVPRERLFSPDGTFLASEDLRSMAQRADLTPERRVIAYCNGGVAATSVLFALSMLGFPHLTNYDGSWNEWTQREDLPIEPSNATE